MDRLPRCHGATSTLDPDFKVTGWQHELIRSPLVGRYLDAPASADRDDLEWFEQRLERGLAIGAQYPSEHVSVHNALLAALLQLQASAEEGRTKPRPRITREKMVRTLMASTS
jgi:hypothetical protein